MAVHHAAQVVTHHHVSATPEHANLPKFLRTLHRETSCALNTLLARERYDQPGEIFDKRSTHVMRLCDAATQCTTINYEFLDTTAAGLAARPEHMPGFVFDFELWLRGHIDVPRPDFYFSSKHRSPRTDPLPRPILTSPPRWTIPTAVRLREIAG